MEDSGDSPLHFRSGRRSWLALSGEQRISWHEQIPAVVGKKKKRGRGEKLLGNHQRCWLWGRHAVLEAVRAGRWAPLEFHCVPEMLEQQAYDELRQWAAAKSIPVHDVPEATLTALSRSKEHQGVAAKMPPFPYADERQVLKGIGGESLVLVLCGIQDPFNFGSILRSADLFDVEAVFVPEQGQAPVSSHVARSSVGAVHHLRIVQTASLTNLCQDLLARGVQLAGATEKQGRSPADANLRQGTAILIGSESSGVPPELLELCQTRLCIPMGGHVGSLNAAVAAGILCYEARRQRGTNSDG